MADEEAKGEGFIPVPGDFGPFYLEKELGHGGMGGVYLGRDTMLDRPEAIKVMLPSLGADPTFVERFKKEAQAAAKLQHPNIAQIHRFDIFNGRPYIAMEVCKGGSLDSDMEKNPGRLDVVRVMRVGEQLASALSAAAEAGLVHGDVKPENVLYDNDGNAKLVDFGLAAMQGDSNEIWGTPYYISPEKCQKKKIDYRADIYSLGGTLYHALTGVPPFDGEDAVQVVKARFKGPPRKPSEIRPDIPPEVDAIIMRMLEVEPSRRHPTYQSLLGDFKRYLSKCPQSGAKTTGKRLTIKGRKPKLATASVASTQSVAASGQIEDPGNGAILGRFSMDNVEEEKEGMSALKMVLIAVGGVIVTIVAVVLLIIWMMYSSKVGDEEKQLNEVVTVLQTAKKTEASNREIAKDVVEKARQRADEAEKNCRDTMETLRRHLGTYAPELAEEFGDKLVLDPMESKALIEAIAYTNALAAASAPKKEAAPAPAQAETNAPPAAAAAETNAPNAVAEAPAPAEGEEPAAGEPAQEEPAQDGENAEEPAQEEAKPALELPKQVQDVIALWNDAYLCRAAEIETSAIIAKAVAKADKLCAEAMAYEQQAENTPVEERLARADLFEKAAQLYGEAGTAINESLNDAKARKSANAAAGKEKQILRAARMRLPLAEEILESNAREAKRKRDAEEAAARKQAEQERAEQELKEKSQVEMEKAVNAFNDMAGTRLRQLSWDLALKDLDRMSESLETRAGQEEAKFQRWKIEIMRDFYNHLIKFSKGAELAGKNRSITIVDANAKGFTAQANVRNYRTGKFEPEGKPVTIEWYKLYRAGSEKHKHLGVRMDWLFGKMLYTLVEKGRESENPRLKSELANTKRWCDRQLGAALTLSLLCENAEDVSATIERLAKDAVKDFPDYEARAKRLFPDMNFSGDEEEQQPAAEDATSGDAAAE